jgi:hypothetical protein
MVGTAYATHGETDPQNNSGDRTGTGNLRDAKFNVLTWDPRGFG